MTEPANLDRYETLTSSEREVLRMVAEGLTNPEIATRLGISLGTVETHLSDVMQKLDLHTQADLIRFALRRGIILMED
jgi:two-component system, NarL family, response regulator NreC